MDSAIGETAGDVYRFLEQNGAATVSGLRKGTGHKESAIHQAIGWLARENKVVRDTAGRATRWTLAGRA